MITLRTVKYTEQPTYQPVRPLTDDELLDLVREVFDEADRLWREAPREWKDYTMLVGCLFGVNYAIHNLSLDQYDKCVQLLQLELTHQLPQAA